MSAYRKILIVCFVLFLSSCTSFKPVLTAKNADMSREIKQKAPKVSKVDISPDGRYVLSGAPDSFILWDILQGKKIRTFAHPSAEITDTIAVAFSPDGKYFASGGKGTKLWDFATRQEIRTFNNDRAVSIAFSPDGRYLLCGGPPDIAVLDLLFAKSSPSTMKIFDVSSGNEVRDFKLPIYATDFIWSVAYSPDGKYVLSGSGCGMSLWDISRGMKQRQVGQCVMLTSVAFSSDGEYALSGGRDKSLILWNARNLTQIKNFVGHTDKYGISSVAFSSDGKYVLSASYEGQVKIWELASGTERSVLAGHTGMQIELLGTSAKFSPNGKYVISAGDASTRIWDVSTGEEVASMVAFEDGEWLFITAEGYYNASERGAQYWNATVGDKSYSVDQFYDVFYRPDIVAAKLRGEDIKGLITITMKDAIKSPPPTVEIANPKDTDSPKIKVCYSVRNTGGGIGEVRLFHNGKLIQSDGYYREVAKTSTGTTQLALLNSRSIYADMRSLNIKAKTDSTVITGKSKGELFEDCKEIDAIAGENEVSVSAFNGNNTVQSYMKTVSFNSRLKQEDPHLYILAIGIDQYKDTGVNLKYAVKDARDIEEKIKVQSATLYNPKNIHYELLTDREATKVNITKKIDALVATIKPQDNFILFVAGHGILLQNQYYMLTHEFDGKVSEQTMISSNEIVEMSKKIKSLSQLFIFDTCHAGGVDTIVSGLYDARMSVLAKKMGLHIYASASDKQVAMDGYKGNGLFTYTLLDGLDNNRQADKNKDGKVSIVGLGEYSKKMTTNISKQIGHEQTPLIINFGKDSPIYKLQ
jgi:WD40 repeat protein